MTCNSRRTAQTAASVRGDGQRFETLGIDDDTVTDVELMQEVVQIPADVPEQPWSKSTKRVRLVLAANGAIRVQGDMRLECD